MNKEMLIEQVGALFVNGMPFNQFLNISVESLSPEQGKITFPWQDVFIGNPAQKILHGGIISAVLDNVGGMLAAASVIDKLTDLDIPSVQQKLATLGTIDLRTDYLRPGKGEAFTASATLIRSGNKVCVCRMDLHNEKAIQIAFGTGTYLVG
ncbi:thioesterase family protein [Pseudoalteromonas sp. 1CM17D]|uniref:thioesterase family protein n=1 Tax=Pseudoalteromonas sp. 1CM17D TaxID=2929162 RepID=UPI0020BDC34F|nr:thioesterase family protein [Pseudoalteromonas sp. 1CM17D]MCK8094655.1 thioesterase family protein [Pseudoalteromonas sp. 1CM17D]